MKHQLSEKDAQEFHREQYKMLREEILEHQREMNRTEASGIIAIGAAYGWLLVNKDVHISWRFTWFIAPCVVLLCAIRNSILTVRINRIGSYLRSVEEVLIGPDTRIPGWERYYAKHGKRWPVTMHTLVAILVGILAFVATWIASAILSK